MTSITTEQTFESEIEAHLLAHGYTRGDPKSFDPNLALLPDDLIAYIQTTQSDLWTALTQIHGDKLRDKVLRAFDEATEHHGLLYILRRGLRFSGKTLRLVTFRPPNSLNPDTEAAYAANRLTVVRQLHHDPRRPRDSLDMVLFVNGIPVVTAELKRQLKGQSVEDAKRQYQDDRDATTPIFWFKRRALINFAVDTDLVAMTARLEGDQTHFLPFNKGIGTQAGNPIVEGDYRTSYLWRDIWQRDNLLDLIGHYLFVEQRDGKQRMTVPRYHQLDCVRELERALRASGAGSNYLIQHSTGSGKSNTIAWLAHRLTTLSADGHKPIFDCVVVVTDRMVIDQQLQETIDQVSQQRGVVHNIETNSAELAKALERGSAIIVTLLHKFGFVADKIGKLPDRRYAVIVDEAHSSQTGTMRETLRQILGDSRELSRRARELAGVAARADASEPGVDEDDLDVGQDVLRAALARGPLANLSFFAFTATPKRETLQVFGHCDEDGEYAPFHLYSMRQAIEEGYILDVLRGYTTYRRYFELVRCVAEDPRLDKRQATRTLMRLVDDHPETIQRKLEIIIEHFRERVQPQLGGRAKAMIVTASREQAVRYRLGFDRYVQAHGYNMRAYVAFSGEVPNFEDPEGPAFTESRLNRDAKGRALGEKGLPAAFAKPDAQVLIVAYKYETGFDQPLLCAMYIDRALNGIKIVQTLSRLNRTYPGKRETFVLDFVNTREHIQAGFQDYYEGTSALDDLDPADLERLRERLWDAEVLRRDEVEAAAALLVARGAGTGGRLDSLLDHALERLRGLEADDSGAAQDFLAAVNGFVRLYTLLAEVVDFADAGLESLFLYVRALRAKLDANKPVPERVRVGEFVELAYVKLAKQGEGAIELATDGGSLLTSGHMGVSGGGGKVAIASLSGVIDRLNRQFHTEFDDTHRVAVLQPVIDELVADPQLRQSAQVNDEANFALSFDPRASDALADRHEQHEGFVEQVLGNEQLREFLLAEIRREVYSQLRGG